MFDNEGWMISQVTDRQHDLQREAAQRRLVHLARGSQKKQRFSFLRWRFRLPATRHPRPRRILLLSDAS